MSRRMIPEIPLAAGHRRPPAEHYEEVLQLQESLRRLEAIANIDWDMLKSFADGSLFQNITVEMLPEGSTGYWDPETGVLHIPIGARGVQGPQGEQGEQGPRGTAGRTPPRARDGIDGKTPVYDFWIDGDGYFQYKLTGYKIVGDGE